MDREAVASDQIVKIGKGRILSLSRDAGWASGCRRDIDAAGLYLAPGLNDMHVHVESQAFVAAFAAPAQSIPYEDVLFPYIANGVTGVRIMSGASDLLAFRAGVHGPTPIMMLASPMLSGRPAILPEPATRVVETPEAALAAVAEFAEAGYDFIKIRENLTPDVLNAVLSAAAERNLLVDGHIPARWSNAEIFSGRLRGIAHLDVLAGRFEDRERDPSLFARNLVACGCFVTSTLSVEQSASAQIRDYGAVASRPEARYVHPLLRQAFWDRARNPYLQEGAPPEFFDRLLQDAMALARSVNDQGGVLLAGTDALSPMIVPGASMADELELLVQAGLSPYDALRAATHTPAETFVQFADVGVVAPGRRANLILLRANPLTDIAAVRRPVAVVLDGAYFDRAALDARLNQMADRYARGNHD